MSNRDESLAVEKGKAGMKSLTNQSEFLRQRSPKASELIARQIANHIVEADLSEGDRLPSEREMKQLVGVGRGTLREALRLLETRGLITIKRGQGGGPFVRRPSSRDFADALTLLLQFEGASLRDVIDARKAIEPTVARLGAERITGKQLAILRQTAELMRGDPSNNSLFQEQNRIFHETLSKAAQSKILEIYVDSLKSVFDGVAAGVSYSPRRHLAAIRAHENIISALDARNGDLAAQAMFEHLDEADRYWSKKYPGLMSRPVRWL